MKDKINKNKESKIKDQDKMAIVRNKMDIQRIENTYKIVIKINQSNNPNNLSSNNKCKKNKKPRNKK